MEGIEVGREDDHGGRGGEERMEGEERGRDRG